MLIVCGINLLEAKIKIEKLLYKKKSKMEIEISVSYRHLASFNENNNKQVSTTNFCVCLVLYN